MPAVVKICDTNGYAGGKRKFFRKLNFNPGHKNDLQ
jgi:hypothetical protein